MIVKEEYYLGLTANVNFNKAESENKYGKVKPETFEKIVKTFRDKYNVEFQFCKPNECGAKIIELLGGKVWLKI